MEKENRTRLLRALALALVALVAACGCGIFWLGRTYKDDRAAFDRVGRLFGLDPEGHVQIRSESLPDLHYGHWCRLRGGPEYYSFRAEPPVIEQLVTTRKLQPKTDSTFKFLEQGFAQMPRFGKYVERLTPPRDCFEGGSVYLCYSPSSQYCL